MLFEFNLASHRRAQIRILRNQSKLTKVSYLRFFYLILLLIIILYLYNCIFLFLASIKIFNFWVFQFCIDILGWNFLLDLLFQKSGLIINAKINDRHILIWCWNVSIFICLKQRVLLIDKKILFSENIFKIIFQRRTYISIFYVSCIWTKSL